MAPAETTGTARASFGRDFAARLFAPVDIASLVYIRILFGAILLIDIFAFFRNGWIEMEYIRPRFHFTFYGFGWVHPLPGNAMYVLFGILGVTAFFILIGFAYRLSAIIFFLGFTYVFLLEEALYLNHYYFVVLVSFLMIFIPANRKLAVDAWLRPEIASDFAPAWALWILRAQMGFVYFYGGIAKINSDWLTGWPLRIWLPEDLRHVPVLSALRHEVWLAILFSYAGLFLDLFAVPLLLWRKSRPWMFLALALFHLTNLNMFDIGIFPWFATAMTALYFDPGWPRRAVAWAVRKTGGVPPAPPNAPAFVPIRFRAATTLGLGVYFAIQVLFPLRHFLYPGATAWNEEGHRFSWRMKLRGKEGTAAFLITDPETGSSWEANIPRYLPRWQYVEMAQRPDMILQFAHYLADHETHPGHKRVEVRAEIALSLNGRHPQEMIDPTVNLAEVKPSLRHASWITELTAPRRKSLLNGSTSSNP